MQQLSSELNHSLCFTLEWHIQPIAVVHAQNHTGEVIKLLNTQEMHAYFVVSELVGCAVIMRVLTHEDS
jgi:hypothetical protein